MSVFARFKRTPEGFRALIELWESTPMERRKRMIEIGMAEDPVFAQRALEYVMTFNDVMKLPDVELAELMATAPPRVTAVALHGVDEAVQQRFIRNSKPTVGAEIRDYLNAKVGPREIGGAQLKLVEKTRELERRGLVLTKKIPLMRG
ncbi:MAG: hypothetical protein NDJ89_14770 [Oligoflexia bacterium]|nr:hypothetical protein [Oligoflexia bacterium]